MRAKYVDPFTGFGFKLIFGEETGKIILLDFLKAILPPHMQITSLVFMNPAETGNEILYIDDIYDVYGENEFGEKIIIELQKAKQNYFKERTTYYSSFPIVEWAEQEDRHTEIKAIYCIGLLDFAFNDYDSDIYAWKIEQALYNKLTYISLELPNFNKSEAELETRLDKWLYFIKHLEYFQNIPEIFRNEVIFSEAFDKAELSNLDHNELDSYEKSLKAYRDLKNVIDTAWDEGVIEGIAKGKIEGKVEVARALKANGVAIDIIVVSTGLSIEQINNI